MRFANSLSLKVKTEKLLKTLKHNRENHDTDYKEAVAQFLTQSVSMLEDRANAVKSRKIRNLHEVFQFNLPVPVSYIEAYDEVIKMLEYSEQEEIEISGDQYRAWVEDKWDWSRQFEAATLSYKGAGIGAVNPTCY